MTVRERPRWVVWAVAAAAVAALAVLLCAPGFAESPVSGHLKLFALPQYAAAESVDAALGYDWMLDGAIDFRMMFQRDLGNWQFDVAYRLFGRAGDRTGVDQTLVGMFPELAAPPADSWFGLEDVIHDGSRSLLVQDLDRISVGYAGTHAVGRIGRQALTWGNGRVFRPMDLFTPFSYDAIDTEYKPGTDMVYGQWLFDRGDDLQGVVAPRRDPTTGDLESALSSYALKWYRPGRVAFDLLAAEDWGDSVLGLGLVGSARGSVWRVSSTATWVDDHAVVVSAVANWETAFNWGERASQWFVEGYWNGFGVTEKGPDLASLPSELEARLRRGQVFVVNQPYVVAGLGVQWTPLLRVQPSLIVNLRDGSLFAAAEVVRDVSEWMLFSARLDVPVGQTHTEFGGLPPEEGAPFVLGQPIRLVLKLAGYF